MHVKRLCQYNLSLDFEPNDQRLGDFSDENMVFKYPERILIIFYLHFIPLNEFKSHRKFMNTPSLILPDKEKYRMFLKKEFLGEHVDQRIYIKYMRDQNGILRFNLQQSFDEETILKKLQMTEFILESNEDKSDKLASQIYNNK